jgi:prevent-host-death family protein
VQSVKIADLKNNLSRHLIRVRQGGEITVVDRDTPIARIVPFVHGAKPMRPPTSKEAREQDKAADAERIAELVRKGVVSAGEPHALADWLDEHEPIRLPKGSPSAVKALLDMRRQSTR